MKTKDKGRKWMLWFLVSVAALQIYFVQELLAALALFAVGFAALAMVIAGGYLLQRSWEAGLSRLVRTSGGVAMIARRGTVFVEEVGQRPFRRPGSEPAQ